MFLSFFVSAIKINTLSSGSFGSFAGGRQQMTLTSNSQKIIVSADGKTVTAVRTSGNSVSTNPTRTSYVFEGWYLDEEATARPAKGLTFTQDIKLYAKWVPDPNKSVTNNSSIQKVNGSDNLLVPEVLGNIMLYNHTPGARVAKITQGQTVTDAAGNATNFVGELVIEGEDNRYLLPDDILVELVDDDGNVTAKLTKGTGYEYHVWNNRKNATIEVNKQFIKGNIVITAVGYELPPVTATSIRVAPAPESTDYSIQYGQKATFTASAETSQNHVATYQWYIAPYDEITLDNFKYWTYQNQNGVALQNGTAFYTFGAGDPIEVTVSGANKSTLRISGLPVNYYGSSTDTYNNVLHLGGYHVYCVVNSVRNITGQSAIAVSDVAEVQVVKNTYAAPTGLEGSATTYYGSNDGEIVIEQQSNRPTLVYRKAGEDGWTGVTTAQLSAGKLTGLTAGTYQFKYSADTNNEESNITDVIVDDGRYILITYRATGCDNESQRLQYQHVAYNTILSDTIEVVKPEKTGYAFSRWNFPAAAVTSDVVVEAVYTNGVYGITLDGNQATTMGTTSIYERYEDGFYLEIGCHNRVSGNSGITVPTRKGYTFLGYYTAAEGGTQLICADGCLSANMSATRFLGSAILYAHWKSEPVQIQPLENILLNITPAGSQEPVTDGNFDFDTEYVVQITNQTEEEKNVIYVFSNGQLKDTIVDVTFDADNQCEFTLEPELVGGGDITVALGYVEPTTVIDEEPIEKETEELLEEAKENAEELQYSITYADVDSSRAHVDFTGSFVTAAATKGILGLKTTLPQAVKTGYTFAGWFASVRGTGTAITEIPADNMDDITVYAKWIANKYQITYVMNNGTFSEPANIPNQFQYGGTSVQLPTAAQITRENYRFLGWYENAAGIGTPVASVDTMLNHNLKIYAVWEALPIYDIVLTPDGEENSIFTYETVTGFESSQIYEGGQYRFKVCIASAYVIKSVKANGKVLTCEEDVYSITDVVDNMTVVVAVERLVSTQEPEDTIATIGLPDGTTGYFISLEEAVEFAIKHGSDSVIKLEKDLDTLSLEVPAGNAFTIDLNGKSVGTDSLINVSEGAELALVNNSETEPSSYDLTIENRGTVSNAIEIEEMVNYGTVYNSGTVASILQGQSETDGEISRFVNHGNIENMTLESGYYEQGENAQAGSGELPVGLTGFSTIMNGNEYYADFNDAVTIANQSDEDAEILILSDVDNTNKVVDIENTSGHTISLNLNGHSILNGSLNLAGDVAISNGEEENGKNAIISAKVSNAGDLQLDSGVKVSGAVENKGALGVNGAVISGNVNNHESATVENDGTISGVVTNNGDIVNNGTMNNVLQNEGTFDNNGNVQSQFVLNGGKYQVEENAIPLIPASQNTTSGSPAAMSNLNPVSYYGTLEDAIHDANSLSDTEAPTEGLKITLLDDIEDLKESPLVIDSSIPIAIDTNGKKLGNADGSDSIEIAGGSSVSLTDTSDEDPLGEVGKVNVDIANKAGAELSIDEKITVNGDIDNAGDMNNNGTLEGTITNSGSFTNGENGDVNSLVQTGGNTENLGVIDELSVESGGITGDLEEHQDINKVAKIETQDTEGNDTVIYFSDLDSALEYAANVATEAPLTVALLQDVSGEAIELVGDKAAVVLDLNGHTIDNTSSLSVDGEASLLICDTSSTGAGAAPTGSISANIENAGTLVLEDTTTVSGDVTNHGEMTNQGTIIGDITNDGEMTNEGSLSGIVTNDGEMTNEGSLSGTVTNNGEMTNEGAVSGDIMNNGGLTNEGTVDGTIENNGDVTNQGAVGDVKQFAGSFSNGENASTGAITQSGGAITNQNTEGGISSVDLQAGSFAGTQPETPISNGEARIGDIVYGDLASAVEDANAADEAVTITLLGDVELEETEILTLENQNGKEITVDINGNSISGGTIQVGEEESSEETTPVQVSFTDSAPEEEKGTLESGLVVSERGQVGIDKDTTVSGDVTNEGKLDNTGKITGSVTNTGSLNNSDVGTMTSVNQLGGEFNNDGDVEELLVEGGEITGNEATNTSFDNAKLAVTDGETIRYYPSLKAALQDVKENESVILLADISGETVEITKSGITLDLNGHSISNDSSITIAEEAADTAITNTGEPGNAGEMAGSIINYGELAIDSSAVVAQITNEHQLQNDGTVINLTNTGDVTNNSVVENLEFVTGSFAGTEPEVSDLNPVAAIGDRFFGDLDSALEHANTATEDTTITILQDTQLPVDASISGEGGNTVTIDLNGNALSAANGGDTPSEAALNVTGNAGLEITDSSEDKTGVFAADLTVEEGAKAAVDSKVCVDGNIENEGTFENRGDILGDVSNGVTGTFENSTEDSFVGGTVCNEGDMNNAGILNGEVDNSGKLSNSGNIDNDVNNNGNATFENAGNINGQMTNADNAAISNSGAIHQVKLEGGTLDNQGDAQISNLIQSGGEVTAVGNGNIAVSATGGSVSAGADTDETIATLEQAFGPTAEVSYDEETGQYQVTLNTDVQLEAPITLDGIDVAIDLNGQNITGGIGQPAIKVAENTTIMVSDSSESGGGSIQSGDGAAQKALVIEEGGSLEIGGKLDTVDESGSSWIEADDMDGAIHDYSIRILKEPADAAVMEENSVSFAVEAESSLELTYQWYVNKNEDGWALIENEQPSLKLDVDMSMNGWQYRCIIRNEKSHVLSKVVVLTVYEKPVVPIIPVVPVGGEPEEVEDEGDASDIAPEVETRPSTGRPVSPSTTDGETQTPTDNMNQEEEEEASGDTSGDTKLKDETQTEQNIQISSVEEAMNIPVLESANTLDVVLGAGEIILSLDMDGAKLSGTVGNTLKATLSEEELSAIEKGKSVEIRSTLVRYLNLSEIEDSVLAEMAQATNLYGEYLTGLNAGQYVDISLEKRIDGSDWIELHELNEELEIVVSIPEELQSDGRVYFMLRNHFGTCELLQDMDTDDLTITVLSDKFSTYQIMYIDAVAKEQIKELNLDLINNKVAMQLAANSGWLDRSGVIWIAIALLAIVSLLISYEYFGRKKRKKDE